MQKNELRRIAVYVDEAAGGGFCWVLIEQVRAEWVAVQRARKAEPAYRAAMAAGLLALQALVGDLDDGPRQAADEGGGEAPEDDVPAGRKAFFGFGQVR